MSGENARYIVRPAIEPKRFLVWDTRAEAVVYGGELLFADAASTMARRLNEQYDRVQRDFCPIPG